MKTEPVKLTIVYDHQGTDLTGRTLKNYLRCRCGVKNKLKMRIHHP